jgi:hypothetical protein
MHRVFKKKALAVILHEKIFKQENKPAKNFSEDKLKKNVLTQKLVLDLWAELCYFDVFCF